MVRLLILIGCLLFAPHALAADDGWRLETDADGIQVRTCAVVGQTIREIHAVTRVSPPLHAVVAVIDSCGLGDQCHVGGLAIYVGLHATAGAS